MAVTKIHRTSKTVLIIGVLISIVVMALFYLGGQVPGHEKIAADMSQPRFTDLVLYWGYFLLGITIVVLLLFALTSFIKQLKESPRKALGGLLAVVGIAALLLITYSIGDGTRLNIPGYDGPDNRPATLKLTDMWLYSSYVLLALTFLAILILPLFKRKA
ncbi:MAG: Membrane protein [Proteiniphilum sp. 51_7]|nr:MAG: Membrane protein [Proteiniphilum sp. 51_7]